MNKLQWFLLIQLSGHLFGASTPTLLCNFCFPLVRIWKQKFYTLWWWVSRKFDIHAIEPISHVLVHSQSELIDFNGAGFCACTMAVRSVTLLHFIGCLDHLDAAWTIWWKKPINARCFEWDISQSPLRLTISFITIICGIPCENRFIDRNCSVREEQPFVDHDVGCVCSACLSIRHSALTFDFIQLYGFTCSYPHALVRRQSMVDMMMRCDPGHRWNTTWIPTIFKSFHVRFTDKTRKYNYKKDSERTQVANTRRMDWIVSDIKMLQF